jgi:SagB-type dehydrogenase family enzyme
VAPPGRVGERLSLRAGVCLARTADGRRHLVDVAGGRPHGPIDPTLTGVLRRLAGAPVTAEELSADHRRGGGAGPADVTALLAELRAGGWLVVTVTGEDGPLYTVVPDRRPPAPAPDGDPSGLVLSRFALLHRDGGEFVLESPRSWCQLRIHDPRVVALLGGLLPRPEAGPGGAGGPVTEPAPTGLAHRLRTDLWWAGLAAPAPEAAAEDEELRLSQWSPHELWMHDRSRIGRRGPADYGATWWARGRFDPPPAARPQLGPVVDLPRPDLAVLRASDPPVTAVLEDRRSIRRYDDRAPLRLAQLAEFLYRCAADRRHATWLGFEYLSRPYPAGGAAYELEIFPVVRRVADLAAGMYHYQSRRHQLELVCPLGGPARRLLRGAAWAMGGDQPQVLLVIAARFGRVMFKYEQMAYALVLKHVGVLYQMMYTVATAMGLAPCGLGVGDSHAFAEATGLDSLEESSVGEFALGSRAAAAPAGGGAG